MKNGSWQQIIRHTDFTEHTFQINKL